MTDETEVGFPKPGEIGFTWIEGFTGLWVSFGQWLAGDGGLWPWRRYRKRLPKGWPTHVFWVLNNGTIVEAQPGGARIGHISDYADRQVLYSKLPLTDEQRARVDAVGRSFEGVPYNWFDYLYLALWRVHIRPTWLRNRVRDSGHMICSQLVDKGEEMIGMNLFIDDRLNQDVTPGQLFRFLNTMLWCDW
jgi:hypothetical protein